MSDRLTKHFSLAEFLAGNPISIISKKGWKPDWILRSLVVAEIARDLWFKKTGRTGIIISSGVRPRGSAKAPKSRHVDGMAIDLKPVGSFVKATDYDDFYGCIIQAQAQVLDCTYGIGYYKSSKSGIHIDADNETSSLRKNQNVRDGLSKLGIRGWRWMESGGYRWVESTLLPLYNKYEKPFVTTLETKTWREWYEIFKSE
jgi:hypothetical protein